MGVTRNCFDIKIKNSSFQIDKINHGVAMLKPVTVLACLYFLSVGVKILFLS